MPRGAGRVWEGGGGGVHAIGVGNKEWSMPRGLVREEWSMLRE